MIPSELQDLPLSERGVVFQEGKYIAAREYYNHRINLYSLYDFFVEALYFLPENVVVELKVVDDKGLKLRFIRN